jgi:hypothetical protein
VYHRNPTTGEWVGLAGGAGKLDRYRSLMRNPPDVSGQSARQGVGNELNGTTRHAKLEREYHVEFIPRHRRKIGQLPRHLGNVFRNMVEQQRVESKRLI